MQQLILSGWKDAPSRILPFFHQGSTLNLLHMIYNELVKNEIFPIAVGNEFGKDPDAVNILYSPFTDNALLVTSDFVQQVERQMEQPSQDASEAVKNVVALLTDFEHRKKTALMNRDPLRYERMTILPNNVCNFRCSYCYSAHGRTGKTLSPEILRAAIDHFIDNKRVDPSKKIAISILGGGEPMVSWDLTKFIIEYGNERAKAMGFPELETTLVTNGSIMTQEMIDIIKKYKVIVSVSFEILEEIQNLQRGHYDIVSKNIDWMISEGIRPALRACITLDNLHLMKRTVEEVLTRFPGTREVMMEYVADAEILNTPEKIRDFYRQYLDNFLGAHDYAEEHGLYLDCSAYRNFDLLIERFCPGDNVLTPEGELSICSRISSPNDPGYAQSIYGRVNPDGTVDIDYEKFNQVVGLDVYHYPKCKNCFAKWHCGGGCMAQKHIYSEEILDEFCEFTRNFTKRKLLSNLEKEYKKTHGITLQELVDKCM